MRLNAYCKIILLSIISLTFTACSNDDDFDGERLREIYEDGRMIAKFEYDGKGRIIKSTAVSHDFYDDFFATYSYDGNGKLSSVTRNVDYEEKTYDVIYTNNDKTIIIGSDTTDLDAKGRVISRRRKGVEGSYHARLSFQYADNEEYIIINSNRGDIYYSADTIHYAVSSAMPAAIPPDFYSSYRDKFDSYVKTFGFFLTDKVVSRVTFSSSSGSYTDTDYTFQFNGHYNRLEYTYHENNRENPNTMYFVYW